MLQTVWIVLVFAPQCLCCSILCMFFIPVLFLFWSPVTVGCMVALIVAWRVRCRELEGETRRV